MKTTSFLLAGSLVGNVGLLSVILLWHPAAKLSGRRASETSSTTVSSGEAFASAGKTGAKPTTPTTTATANAGTTWDRLRSEDLAALVVRLKAGGFPPAALRVMLEAIINERFPQLRQLQAREDELPFWRQRFDYPSDPRTRAEIARLTRERDALLKNLLVPDTADPEMLMSARRQYGPTLSPEKLARLQEISRDYGELQEQIQAASRGSFLPEDREKIMLLQREQRADIAKLLTAQEFLDYELRNSSAAHQLRFQTAAVDLTEAEFRALFPLYRALDEMATLSQGNETPEKNAALQAAHQRMQDEIKALLGAERYAEFQNGRDYSYQQTAKLVARLSLPPATTAEVYALQKDFQRRASSLRSTAGVAPAERDAQLAALATEATAKVTTILGASGAEAYKQYGGSWLAVLAPRTPARVAPKP